MSTCVQLISDVYARSTSAHIYDRFRRPRPRQPYVPTISIIAFCCVLLACGASFRVVVGLLALGACWFVRFCIVPSCSAARTQKNAPVNAIKLQNGDAVFCYPRAVPLSVCVVGICLVLIAYSTLHTTVMPSQSTRWITKVHCGQVPLSLDLQLSQDHDKRDDIPFGNR